LPIYQRLVGEITTGKLIALDDLSHPLLRQIAERAPGTWQHSLMMANLADIAANEIGANARLVRVGAYFHDLGKSLQPKYFIENLEPGEISPHDQLPPEVSCDAIFAHVTEGIVTARNAGLHERIVDFMHMHHGNGILEYFWGKTREQGNPKELSIDYFRYPGVPPQSRETAILAICDAVEAASRTLKKPDSASIDSLVQRIVYGKLHLGQLDESGLSMSDLRRVVDSLRDTIRHANHGRIEYPWQKEAGDTGSHIALSASSPRLDSLDRPARADSVAMPSQSARNIATEDTHQTPVKAKATIVDNPTTMERRAFSLDDPSTSERRAFALDETAPINEDLITEPRLAVAEAPRRPDNVPRQTLIGSGPHRTPAGRPVPEGVPDALLAGPGSSPLRLPPSDSGPRADAVALRRPPTMDPGARAQAVPIVASADAIPRVPMPNTGSGALRTPPTTDPGARADVASRTQTGTGGLRTPPGMDPSAVPRVPMPSTGSAGLRVPPATDPGRADAVPRAPMSNTGSAGMRMPPGTDPGARADRIDPSRTQTGSPHVDAAPMRVDPSRTQTGSPAGTRVPPGTDPGAGVPRAPMPNTGSAGMRVPPGTDPGARADRIDPSRTQTGSPYAGADAMRVDPSRTQTGSPAGTRVPPGTDPGAGVPRAPMPNTGSAGMHVPLGTEPGARADAVRVDPSRTQTGSRVQSGTDPGARADAVRVDPSRTQTAPRVQSGTDPSRSDAVPRAPMSNTGSAGMRVPPGTDPGARADAVRVEPSRTQTAPRVQSGTDPGRADAVPRAPMPNTGSAGMRVPPGTDPGRAGVARPVPPGTDPGVPRGPQFNTPTGGLRRSRSRSRTMPCRR